MEQAGRTGPDGNARRVRVPWFPVYGEVRPLLWIWTRFTKSHVTGLHSTLTRLRGNPQNPVDWRDPDSWIPNKLDGEDLKLAQAIWTESGKSINPRHMAGHWVLSQKYQLLVDGGDGNLRMTERGRDFIDHEFGEAEAFLDLQEGVIELLMILADSGSARFGALVDPWADFLKRRSGFRSPSTIRDTLRRRLRNLLDRGLLDRERQKYTVTDTGLQYLTRVRPAPPDDELQAIRDLSRKREATVREDLHKHLLQMDPIAFEHLVAQVLEAMDYENVKVTGPSGDGGVDVVAESNSVSHRFARWFRSNATRAPFRGRTWPPFGVRSSSSARCGAPLSPRPILLAGRRKMPSLRVRHRLRLSMGKSSSTCLSSTTSVCANGPSRCSPLIWKDWPPWRTRATDDRFVLCRATTTRHCWGPLIHRRPPRSHRIPFSNRDVKWG